MFDRFFDLLVRFFTSFAAFVIVNDFERGVVLRWGVFHKELEPGFHGLIPFKDRALKDNVVPRTTNLHAQSLTTKDGRSIVVGAVITSRIRHIRKAILECEHHDNVMEDSCYGQIGTLVAETDWADLHTEAFADRLREACRQRAFLFGIEIMKVQLSDLAISRAIRLYQNAAQSSI